MGRVLDVNKEPTLHVDIAGIVDHPGASKQIALNANVPGLAVVMGRVADEGKIHADLLIESLVEGVLVSGTLTGTYLLECARCLTEFESPFSVDVSEVYSYPDQPDIDEEFVVEDDAVDLVPMVRDEVLIGVPPNPLHDEACMGLCATCGEDLNVRDCGHLHEQIDLRWEPLKRLASELPDNAQN